MTAMYISKRRLIYQYSNEFHFVGQISKQKIPLGTKGRTSICTYRVSYVLVHFILHQQKKIA